MRTGIVAVIVAAVLLAAAAVPAVPPETGPGAGPAGSLAAARAGLADARLALDAAAGDRRILLAQSRELPDSYAAEVEIRLQELERRIQALTGEVEEAMHRARQAEDRLDRALADIEFRLTTLEGGDPSAAPPSGGAGTQPPASGAEGPSTSGVLGTLALPGPPPDGRPGDAVASLPEGDPARRYDYAYGLLQRGDYAGAQAALQQFIGAHGNHPLASNAYYWLGETFYARSRFEDAATAFAQGYQRYPDGAKAVDSLLKLGMSLARMGQRDDACLTLAQLREEFPDGPIAVQRRAEEERRSLGCR